MGVFASSLKLVLKHAPMEAPAAFNLVNFLLVCKETILGLFNHAKVKLLFPLFDKVNQGVTISLHQPLLSCFCKRVYLSERVLHPQDA